LGVKYDTVWQRLKRRGYSLEKALGITTGSGHPILGEGETASRSAKPNDFGDASLILPESMEVGGVRLNKGAKVCILLTK
jgi:hypothetical protein